MAAAKVTEVPNVCIAENSAWSYQIPVGYFTGTSLTYKAEIHRRTANCSLNRGSDINWLTFNKSNRTFSGTPSGFSQTRSWQLIVTATDTDGSTATSIFNLTVTDDAFVGTRKPRCRYNQTFDHTITAANIGAYNWGSISSGQFVKISSDVGNPSGTNTTHIDTARTAGAIICWEIAVANKDTLDYSKCHSFDTIGLTNGVYKWYPVESSTFSSALGAPVFITNLGGIATIDDNNGTLPYSSIKLGQGCNYFSMCGQGTAADPYGLKIENRNQPAFQIKDGTLKRGMEVCWVEVNGCAKIGFHFKTDLDYNAFTFNTISNSGGKIKIVMNGVDRTSTFPASSQQDIVFVSDNATYDERGRITSSVFTGGNTELTLNESYTSAATTGTIYQLIGERPGYDWDGLHVNDNYIHDTRDEGVGSGGEGGYIGDGFGDGNDRVLPGSRLMYPADIRHCRVNWNIFERTGWDGFQVRNVVEDGEVNYNYVKDTGLGGWPDFATAAAHWGGGSALDPPAVQTQGIDIGTYSVGEMAYNYVENAMNNGVLHNLCGNCNVHHNIINVALQQAFYGANAGKVTDSFKGYISRPDLLSADLVSTIYNNTFYGCGATFEHYTNLTSVLIKNNLFVNCGGTVFIGNAANQSNFTKANNSLVNAVDGNTYFASYGSKDFRTLLNSPVAGGGVSVSLTSDFSGKFIASPYAIGAFEVRSLINPDQYIYALNPLDQTKCTFQWYQADDGVGTNSVKIVGAVEDIYEPPAGSVKFYSCAMIFRPKSGPTNSPDIEILGNWLSL